MVVDSMRWGIWTLCGHERGFAVIWSSVTAAGENARYGFWRCSGMVLGVVGGCA